MSTRIPGQDNSTEKTTTKPTTRAPRARQGNKKQSTDGMTLPNMGFYGNSSSNTGLKRGGEYTEAMYNKFNEIFKVTNNEFDIKLIKIDNTQIENTHFSLIIVCVSPTSNKSMVAYYTMILSKTGKDVQKLTDIDLDKLYVNNAALIDAYVTPGDAYDQLLIDTIVEQITINYNNVKNLELINVDGIVIPSDISHEHDIVCSDIAHNALDSCMSTLHMMHPNFVELSVSESMYIPNSNNGPRNMPRMVDLDLNIMLRDSTTSDIVGNPIRQGFTIELVKSKSRNRTTSINEKAGERVITSVSGYIDVIPWAIDERTSRGMVTVTRMMPHVVITNLEAEHPFPSHSILALGTVSALQSNGLIIEALKPRNNTLRDPSDYNVICDLENNAPNKVKPIDLKKSNLSDTAVTAILSQMCVDDVIYSIDIEHLGPNTSALRIFEDASTSKDAEEMLLHASDRLTGNRVSSVHKGRIIDSVSFVPAITWKDSAGMLRDGREIDTSAIISAFAEKDGPMVEKWLNTTFGDKSFNLPNIADSLNIYRAMLHNADPVVIGSYKRVFIEGSFMTTLSTGLSDAKFLANINAPTVTNVGASFNQVGNILSGSRTSNDHGNLARTSTPNDRTSSSFRRY